MNRIKQRTSVVAAALAVLIGGGAALQALAAGSDAVSQPVAPLLASQPATTARVIDPASLLAAFAAGDAVTGAFAAQASYADLLRGELASSGATFASATTAPGRDLTALAAAVSAEAVAPVTLSNTVSYASSLRAAHLNSGATFQLSHQVAALDLESLAAAFSDEAAEQSTFSDEGSQLGDAYFNPGLAAGSFASDLASTPGRDLSSLAAAVTGGSAAAGTFASQTAGAEDLRTAYFSSEVGTATFANELGGVVAPVSLAELAAAAGGASGGQAGFSTQSSSYADTLRAAHAGFAGFGAGFSTEVGTVSSQFDLDALADAFSDE